MQPTAKAVGTLAKQISASGAKAQIEQALATTEPTRKFSTETFRYNAG
jgi:hypothetical protein